MSGYVVADSEALVMQKVGTNVKYKVTEDQSIFKKSTCLLGQAINIVQAPSRSKYVEAVRDALSSQV